MNCALCGAKGADSGHAIHGILCDSCYKKQDPLCDFCSSPEVKWRYEVETFTLKGIPGTRSVEDWAACDLCHEFIEDGDYPKLALRSVKTAEEGTGVSIPSQFRRMAIEAIGDMHKQFRDNRKGPAKEERKR
jgi:hypothetical protein